MLYAPLAFKILFVEAGCMCIIISYTKTFNVTNDQQIEPVLSPLS